MTSINKRTAAITQLSLGALLEPITREESLSMATLSKAIEDQRLDIDRITEEYDKWSSIEEEQQFCFECNKALSSSCSRYGICESCQDLAILERYNNNFISRESTFDNMAQVNK